MTCRFALVNLGLDRLLNEPQLTTFEGGLAIDSAASFQKWMWHRLIDLIKDKPPWFEQYISERQSLLLRPRRTERGSPSSSG